MDQNVLYEPTIRSECWPNKLKVPADVAPVAVQVPSGSIGNVSGPVPPSEQSKFVGAFWEKEVVPWNGPWELSVGSDI